MTRVLAYHKIVSFELGGTWMPPRRFRRQIDGLLAEGWRFIDEASFLDLLDGLREPAEREILLTFDDGYRDLLHTAPFLFDRGVPALVFLVSDFAGRENSWELGLPGRRARHLDWAEIADLSAANVSFGSHGRTHRDLTRLDASELDGELAGSKRAIEDRIGRAIRTFSFPYGRVGARERNAAREAGYEAAFTLYPPRGAAFDRWRLRREGVWIIDTLGAIRAKMGTGPRSGFEDWKGRAINAVAVLTPVIKGDGRRDRG